MKTFRGEPSILKNRNPEDRQAELSVQNLSLSFGGVRALINVSIEVHTGEIFAVIGPNGAGKTSLMNCITGFYKPQEGRIVFNGKDITGLNPHKLVKLGIGRTFQNIELFPRISVISNLMLARHIHTRYPFLKALLFSRSVREEEVSHRRILEELIDFLEIQAIRKKPVGSLPYGMMKRVELGRALALEPKLLVLDEPFAGMTFEEKEDMVRFIKEINEAWGQTIILVEHDMSIVMSISHRIAVLNFGEKIAEGLPEEVRNNQEVIRAYLG
ncbi:MAG: ABC transporter ATP-binding protein [Syntrophales bacterium]|nr:ABC transporter ATP-binding protein [Syntrophales bacterium]